MFLLLTLSSVLIIYLLTFDRRSALALLRSDPRWILASLASLVSCWLVDAWRIKLLVAKGGGRMTILDGLRMVWLNYFGCAVTPFQGGGAPFLVFYLHRKGVPLGKGVSLVLLRSMITLLMVGLVGLLGMALYPEFVRGKVLGKLFYSISVAFGLIWGFVVLSMLMPRLLKRITLYALLTLRRLKLFGGWSVMRIVRFLFAEIDNYSVHFRSFFLESPLLTAFVVILSVLYLFFWFSVLPLVARAFGYPLDLRKAFVLQSLLMFVLYLTPTPGGSGVAEGGGVWLFSSVIPFHASGVVFLSSRLLTDYLPITLGGLVILSLIGYKGASKVEEEIERIEEEVVKEDEGPL